ncbi:hypothetical protein Hypma_014829 [Hypsizygus marmoreus]|uniref:DUF6534 domain-containing protein n=1 Tax=Hypsizygus marmoreus TaxID=39966 RepID=A0A369K279_HYPMA|nr:hypothetical protein Hypma_014829 [Hypsizygus marmoreus]
MASACTSFNISQLDGGMLAGIFLACSIWGASSFQTFLYFLNCDKDSFFLRYLVGVLWVLDTANQVLLAKGNWRSLISRYGSPDVLASVPEYMHHAWISVLVNDAVQLYFIHRIYVFAKSSVYRPCNVMILNSIFAILLVLVVYQPIAVTVFVIYGYGQPLDLLVTKQENAVNLSGRAAAVTIDIVVAACMVFLLTREAPYFKRSRRLVHRLLIITVSSGSLTALLVTICLILVIVYPDTLYWIAIDFSLCSVYLSTLLANLNTRGYIRGDYEVTITPDIELGNSTGARSSKMAVVGQRRPGSTQAKTVHPVSDGCIRVESRAEQNGPDTSTASKAEA